MTQTPPDTDPGPRSDHSGPRVGPSEIRDLARLRRSSGDRKIAGVAGGIARHLDIDPLVVRIVMVVLALFGGAGFLLYAAGWLFLPEDRSGEAVIRLDDRSRGVALIAVGAIAALALVGDAFSGWGFPWPLAVLAVIGAVLYSRRDQAAAAPPPTPHAWAGQTDHPAPADAQDTGYPGQQGYASYQGDADPSGYRAEPPSWNAPPAQPAPPAPPRAPRRTGPLLFFFTLALIALAEGVLGTLDLAGVPVVDSAYPALALGLTGVMLLVGAFYGRAGGLIALGLVAAVATAGAIGGESLDTGKVVDTPRSAAAVDRTYSVGGGRIELDLTEVADPENLDGLEIDLNADFGRIQVTVPDDVTVIVDADVRGVGSTDLFGDSQDDGQRETRFASISTDTTPTLEIDASVGFGEIEFRNEGAAR